MKLVAENIYIGDKDDCIISRTNKENIRVIHACKTCWKANQTKEQACPEDYLYYEKDGDLYLNLIDAPMDLQFLGEIVLKVRDFMIKNNDKPILIHCDQGKSRSVKMADLMAKWTN